VKHFKWKARGKRRIHERPSAREVRACRPWLEREAIAVKPEIVVCLGATAAQSILGRKFKLSEGRGKIVHSDLAPRTIATIHPSFVLRQRTSEDRDRALAGLSDDLAVAARALGSATSRAPRTRRSPRRTR
jgi:DNA polymerase